MRALSASMVALTSAYPRSRAARTSILAISVPRPRPCQRSSTRKAISAVPGSLLNMRLAMPTTCPSCPATSEYPLFLSQSLSNMRGGSAGIEVK
jgi:hypothetical protein